MQIDQPGTIPPTGGRDDLRRRATTPDEAARQFEAILVRQFVATMTDNLFTASLTGEEGPGWMKGQQDTQRDVLTDVLTQHLVASGTLRIADMLVRRWHHPATEPAPPTEPETP